jgi:predicted nucleotidyltransferase
VDINGIRPITDELVQEVTRKIVERFNPKRIIAFGSYARGEGGPDSDLDLIVELESEKPFWERTIGVGKLFVPRDWALDLLVYTPEKFAEHKQVWGTLVSLITDEAKVLYERPT